jgi:hypothetical protein
MINPPGKPGGFFVMLAGLTSPCFPPSFRHRRACPDDPEFFLFTLSIPQDQIQIFPLRIHIFDQVELPLSVILLDVFLSLNRVANIELLLTPDQYPAAILTREAWNQTFTMLPSAMRKIIGHAGIKRAITLGCHDVNISGHDPLLHRGF